MNKKKKQFKNFVVTHIGYLTFLQFESHIINRVLGSNQDLFQKTP